MKIRKRAFYETSEKTGQKGFVCMFVLLIIQGFFTYAVDKLLQMCYNKSNKSIMSQTDRFELQHNTDYVVFVAFRRRFFVFGL